MHKTFLLILLTIVLGFTLVYKSPFSAKYNYNKAKELYDKNKFTQSIPYFEKSLFAKPNSKLSRFFYVLALSKSEPTYSVQKKLYEMSESKINDEATRYAKTQIKYMRFKLLDGIESNYITNSTMGNDILRWDIRTFPLSVYFEDSETVPQYYVTNIKKAMSVWTNNTNFIKFKDAKSAENSDILIKFSDISKDLCQKEDCKFAVAYTEPKISKDKILKKMVMTFYKTNPNNKSYSENEIFTTAVHEFGHALGIMGHSDNDSDIMYAKKSNSYQSSEALSERDLKTLILLYRIKPTISNTKNNNSENLYYPQLIIGSDDSRLQQKLKENLEYVKTYPNIPAGYINLASVYGDMGDYDTGLETLNKAESLAKTDDEKFIINYNRAIFYFNKREYNSSKEFAQIAQSIKNDANIQELLEDIENLRQK